MNTGVLTGWRSKRISADELLFYAFLGTFFCLPLGTSPPTICGLLGVSLWLFSGMPVRLKHIWKRNWFRPVILFIALHWIGLLYTPDLGGLGIEYAEKTYYWLYCLAVASIAFEMFPPQKLIKAFLYGLAFNVIVALLQLVGGLPAEGGRYHGLGPEYSTLSAYLIVGILTASFYFRGAKDKKSRITACVLMALYFFHLIILESRTGYLTFFLLSPVLVYNLFRQFGFFRIALVCTVILGVMFLSPVVRERVYLSADQLKYHLNAPPEAAWGRSYTANQDRFYMWYGAVHIFLDHPVFGVGTGGYQQALKERGKPEDPFIAHPHNDLLHVAVSFGIFGIFAFFWLFGTMLKNAWAQRGALPSDFVLSATLVILISSLFNGQILDVGMAFLLALTVGLQQTFPEHETTKNTKSTKAE